MAAYGIPEDEIVKLVTGANKRPIAPKTLRKHFRVELDRGMTNANVRVLNGLFKNATTESKVHPGGNPILQMFWAKCRLGWRQDGTRAVGQGQGTTPVPGAPETEEVGMLEAARRLAFTITMGVREAAAEGTRKAAPKQAKKARAAA